MWQLCTCKTDNYWVSFLLVFQKTLVLRRANITTLDSNRVLVATEGEDTIDQFEISYAVINVVVNVCVY